MGKNYGNTVPFLLSDRVAEPRFFLAVKGAERFIKQKKIILLVKDAGKMEPLKFSPGE